MKVALITEALAEEIAGTQATSSRLFNPVELDDGQWVISLLEAQSLDETQYEIIEI